MEPLWNSWKDFLCDWSLRKAIVHGCHLCGSYGFNGLLWRCLLYSVLSKWSFGLGCCLSVWRRYSPFTIIRPRSFSVFFLISLYSSFAAHSSSLFFRTFLYSPFVSFPEPRLSSIPVIIFPFFPAWHQDHRHHKQTKWIGYISSWDAVVFGRLELTRFTILLLYQAGLPCLADCICCFCKGAFVIPFPRFVLRKKGRRKKREFNLKRK